MNAHTILQWSEYVIQWALLLGFAAVRISFGGWERTPEPIRSNEYLATSDWRR